MSTLDHTHLDLTSDRLLPITCPFLRNIANSPLYSDLLITLRAPMLYARILGAAMPVLVQQLLLDAMRTLAGLLGEKDVESAQISC
ncbi:hypothetical protein HDU84_006562 [Entophlyctis sp. JEL0112]|nr:hypothetical protein HDU84_006562 [Entophlyctis sp. JEL0112]